MTDLERELPATVQAGRDQMQQRQFQAAATSFDHALRCLDGIEAQGGGTRAVLRAEIAANLAATRFELGKTDGQEASLRRALASFAEDMGSATPTQRAIAGRLNFELGRLMRKFRRIAEGRAFFEAALNWLDGADNVIEHARANAALAVLLCLSGELELALPHFHAARAAFEQSGARVPGREHARLVMNIGTALMELGRYEEALQVMAQGLRLSESALLTEGLEARFDRGRAKRNLGVLLTGLGRHAESINAYAAGLSDYDFVLRRSRRHADLPTMQASRASLLMNLGFGYYRQGLLDAAAACYARAIRAYARLVKSQPFLTDDQARTWVNQAHVAAQLGRFDQAARLYARGQRMFESSITAQRTNLEFDRTNASLGLSRMFAIRGRVKQGIPLFEAAMSGLAELTRQGQLQHAQAWLEAWQAQWSVLQTLTDDAAAVAWAEAMVRVLAEPAVRGVSAGPEPIKRLLAAAQAVSSWTTETRAGASASGARTGVIGHYLVYLFDWAAELLAESEPGWLLQHASLVEQTVTALRCAAAAQPQSSRLLAEWFLHTRGLRAQRAALAQGAADPDIVALRNALQELRQLEDEMLGEGRTAAGSDPNGQSRQPGASLPELVSPGRLAMRARSWRELRDRVEDLRRRLVSAGRLPQMLRLNVDLAVARMAPGAALVMLARVEPGQVLIVVLHRPNMAGVVAQHALIDLHPDFAAFSCITLNQLARQSLAFAARGQALRRAAASVRPRNTGQPVVDSALAPEADLFAIERFRLLWQCTLASMLPSLADQGYVEASLVPSDDLHLMPWSHFADTGPPLGCRLQVYPSSGAWLRSLDDDAVVAPHPPHPPRWALAADAALRTDRPLPCVEVERFLASRLWQADMWAITWPASGRPQSEGVDALLGMGHGGVDDGNSAHAGLVIGDGVLVAHDLPRIQTCTRALLSTCMLGQTDEAIGEPLGFLATCFDYRTSFGTGWLTEVPDVAACLFSLAFQFALHEAYHPAAQQRVWWSEVFRATRQGVSNGQWPPRFAAWLARELRRVSSQLQVQCGASGSELLGLDPASLDTPPPSLRRVIPWAIALGR